MIGSWTQRVGVALALVAVTATPGATQDDLEQTIEAARQAWVAHRVGALLTRSDTVRLQLPGVAEAASVKPGQASRLLADYLAKSAEVSFDLRGLRRLAVDHAYAELTRVFVVRGTTERRTETVFLGFRALGGEWRLREVRVTP